MAHSILPPWAVLGGFLELEGRAGQGIPRQWPGGWGVHWPCCHCVAGSCRGEEGGGACTCLEEKVPGGQERERRETEEITVLHVGHWLYIHKISVYNWNTLSSPDNVSGNCVNPGYCHNFKCWLVHAMIQMHQRFWNRSSRLPQLAAVTWLQWLQHNPLAQLQLSQ